MKLPDWLCVRGSWTMANQWSMRECIAKPNVAASGTPSKKSITKRGHTVILFELFEDDESFVGWLKTLPDSVGRPPRRDGQASTGLMPAGDAGEAEAEPPVRRKRPKMNELSLEKVKKTIKCLRDSEPAE